MSTKREWFVGFRKVAPADLEEWLEGEAKEGWILDRIGQWSSIRMTFRKGEPSTYRYVADMQRTQRPDYRSTYEDAGWEYVGRMASLILWRRAYTGTRPDAFTDQESVRARTGRFLGALLVSSVVLALGSVAMFLGAYGVFGDIEPGDSTQMKWAGILLAVFAIGHVPIMIAIRRRRNE